MSEEKAEKPEIDPLGPMLQFYDAWAKTWSESMSKTVASERFADTMSQQTEAGLDFMALIRRQVSDSMEQYLHQMSLPTRDEVINLAERLTRIEMSLDDLDAKLDEVLDQIKSEQDEA